MCFFSFLNRVVKFPSLDLRLSDHQGLLILSKRFGGSMAIFAVKGGVESPAEGLADALCGICE